jgi:hypothetical protein
MSFDTECDLAVEATGPSLGQRKLRETIVAVRGSLICEHLGVEPDLFSAALDLNSGSVLKAIDALRNPGGRTLTPFDRATIENDESLLAENDLLDPEKMPVGLHRRIVEKIASVPSKFWLGRTSRQN